MRHFVRHNGAAPLRIVLALGTSIVIGALPASTRAGGPEPSGSPGVADITATARGRALAQQAAGRYGDLAASIGASGLVVLLDSTGITIGPRTATYATVTTRGRNGASQVEAVPQTVGRPASLASLTSLTVSAAATAAAPFWSFVANACFTRISDGFSWIDHCYAMYRLANDGDAGRDWFALNHFATMRANPPWVMYAALIGSAPIGGPQAWADWAPRSDMSGNCSPIIVAITTPAGGIPDATTQCEVWTLAKSATAGQFSVKWDSRGQRAARELSMEISVSMPQGGWAQWLLPASVSGSPF